MTDSAGDDNDRLKNIEIPVLKRMGSGSTSLGLEINRSCSAPPAEIFASPLSVTLSTPGLFASSPAAGIINGIEETEALGEDDPRLDPNYADFFYSNSRHDPRLPPPIYAPGQSWKQIWGKTGRGQEGPLAGAAAFSLPSQSKLVRRLEERQGRLRVVTEATTDGDDDNMDEERMGEVHGSSLLEKEFQELQLEIASSSAGSSSSSSTAPSSPKHRKKLLVDMIQEDFPRTPSPVYAQLRLGSAAASTGVNAGLVPLAEATAHPALPSLRKSLQHLDAGGPLSDYPTGQPYWVQAQYEHKAHQQQPYSAYLAPPPQMSMMGYAPPLHQPHQHHPQHQQPPQPLVFGRHRSMGGFPGPVVLGPAASVAAPPSRPKPSHSTPRGSTGKRAVSINTLGASDQATAILEEIKSGRGRTMALADIYGRVVELSCDQHGSRFIQQRLETASASDLEAVFGELLPSALHLMTDVFGNYVIQKFFEHGSGTQKEILANLMQGHVLDLSLQMYGCRVIQKALENAPLQCQQSLCLELEPHVLRCVKDQNGNHVIQKCIECVPPEAAPFLPRAFCGQVYALATHPYGCRVIQRFFEHGTPEQTRPLIEELHRFTDELVQDQYGNYVIQHLLESGAPEDRARIIGRVKGHVLDLSRHKFASNVVEKCVAHATRADRQALIEEVLAVSPADGTTFSLLLMMRDQFANYVVQKMLDLVDGQQRALLLDRIRPHLPSLRKFTYGKHILNKVERMLQGSSRP